MSLMDPLVDFSSAVRQEIDDQASGETPVTVIGHSYGGLTVGMSTMWGLSGPWCGHRPRSIR